MTEAEEDLSSHYQVQESRVILHPVLLTPVLLTRYGWAKRQGFFGERVRWYKQEVTEMGICTSNRSQAKEEEHMSKDQYEVVVEHANGTYTIRIPKKEWVGLTDEQIQDLSYLSQKIDEGNAEWFDRWGFARAVEQALKEKNHG